MDLNAGEWQSMVHFAAIDYLWGKAGLNIRGVLQWAPLQTHLLDTGHVAQLLLEQWVPSSLLKQMANQSGLSVDEFRSLIAFIAGVHDVGKATPAFQAKPLREKSTGHLQARMELAKIVGRSLQLTRQECMQLPHNISGHFIVRRWLRSRFNWSMNASNSLGIIISGHHGITPIRQPIGNVADTPHLLGDGIWQKMQEYLLDECAKEFGITKLIEREILLSPNAQVFVSGLVVLSDWIASDTKYFRLVDDGAALDKNLDHNARAMKALADIRLPNPWEPARSTESLDERLVTGFGLPHGAVANSTQIALDHVVDSLNAPELVILEAPTGSGKTEAALLAAHKIAAKLKLAGITFALPTQATTNAMYTRIFDWLVRLSELGEKPIGDIQLIHGKADLNNAFQSVRFSNELADVHDEDSTWHPVILGASELVRNQWSDRSKLRLLSNVTVCTIDQILMASLKTRHNVLRHVGLSRKVLVVDEVHAADTFMRQYLLRTLEWAGANGIPVICLSATLPSTIRDDLLESYQRGKQRTKTTGSENTELKARNHENQPKNDGVSRSASCYPLVSFTSGYFASKQPFDFLEVARKVDLELADLGLEELSEKIQQLSDSGGRILVIRNTVRSAIETFDALEAAFPGEVTLGHSRFIGAHRIANDAALLEQFGKGDTVDPSVRQIIVATQIAEQSLDIDCDVLFTDIAPMDALLQRIGRLHRHNTRVRPQRFTRARCFILGFKGSLETAPEILGGSARVYDPYLLLKTALEILRVQELGGEIQIPDGVSSLIERTYVEDIAIPAAWVSAMSEADSNFERMEESRRTRALQNCVAAPYADDVIWGFSAGPVDRAGEERVAAQVRDAQESIEVILLNRVDQTLSLIHPEPGIDPRLDQYYVPTDDQLEWLRRSTIRIPGYVLPGESLAEFPQQLENLLIPEWQSSPELKDELFLTIDPVEGTRLGKYLLTYDPQRGLEITT
ncbi:CRISPR-associated helicase Cas3' [Jonesiaceae bacterium BS-20]|uniref:CRISPR-associated helicase Cas3 n=1 Tax=Jonesiaceae bacterium BS-20 TaxID=3120821 RepID=A0AAU7DXV1_9MICO